MYEVMTSNASAPDLDYIVRRFEVLFLQGYTLKQGEVSSFGESLT